MKSYAMDEIIQRAIGKEEEVSSLYQDLSRRITDPATRNLLKELSGEELKHKERLQDFQRRKADIGLGIKSLEDKRISDFLEKPVINKYADAKDVMLAAIKDEEDTRVFYVSWAEFIIENEDVAGLLKKLGEEELKHKARLEERYKQVFSPEN
ncbi:hypothetical protein COY52_04495 [Candidatus Desantisbacteria bacterium CG_4_10_14_0_8_um_filter_48_22]|uniref:Rubrerythrin diiron-binding domain-containing protein n=1 Tax=Candidatus Desantisbacteria bacterium CG_4_10_14_0_8_um_filter_48_22 TaxID=1974543 RepID=A0A2M7SDA2_9BACT|nr:MAG: hypothetical protein AUJ67_04685 [Candidatus Desantisbacteria bacterium CG1_02_49_89]PIV57375.1 MAG: hypothetical protein COS16_00755 [Candidatus Desantisbacteria bacterium CG02_land_8_20_14_3_00_49_13]PIZ17459.1 MAG: hypothetical protein COY52_04495 [Candidatus Desantisbacteria bacterium CG_4_10_14_0_8_um_filter_48_22]PJB27921.1 MAG: hypothetical protein CO111_02945 [Candidatus Desantisbacteria bacterium CG_4_9_14_3_um_filter_50_7]